MKKEFLTNTAKFIFSKDEFGYQEVLDDITQAKEITIITYNISENQNSLIDYLKATNDACIINIVTNIPNRWENYFGDEFRKNARKKINLYLTKLDPSEFGKGASVFFNFSNHGKIIMTNNIVYVGSENFSEESKSNIEFGFLSRDTELIDFIKSEVYTEIKKGSVDYYYESDNRNLLLELNMTLSALVNVRNCIYEGVYLY